MVYKSGDSILLLEDGVYGALVSQPFAAALNDKTCYAIAADVEARGLNQQALLSHIKFIDYNRFVKLCTECDLVQSWY